MSSTIILSVLNTRAKNRFNKPITAENFDDYVQTWFTIAEELQEEFNKESLLESAKEVQEIIDYELKFNSPRTVQIKNLIKSVS